MDKYKLKQSMLLIAAVSVLIAVLAVIGPAGFLRGTQHTVGLIITGKTTDSGWNSAHYNGVVSACEQLGTELIVKKDVAEGNGSCAEAIRQLVKDGAKMIILSSYSYPAEVKGIIDSYPDIAFYAISSEYVTDNLTSYFGRMYQANSVERRWFEIGSGIVGLSELSPQVSDDTRQAVEAAEAKLNGLNDVFSGIIYDNSGTLRCNEGESLIDETLLTCMDWFVDGVVIYEKKS